MKINCKAETNRIVKFIRETFKEKGFKRAVLGISGGIDSAVVCALLVKALGKENIYGVLLPDGEQVDIYDSYLVCKKFGVGHSEINISSARNDLMNRLIVPGARNSAVRVGNIKARVRMICLYDLSYMWNALVVGTGNKTELQLGYFTLYGDGACALEPIGHLYKTQVRQLAKYLKVPKRIIDKAPSAGLWEGQTDEKELGMTYKQMDELLLRLEDHTECILCATKGKVQSIVIQLMDRIEKNKFKSELPRML